MCATMSDLREVLKKDVEAVKEHVRQAEIEFEEVIRAEREHHGRDELLDWLRQKKKHSELLSDEDLIGELLMHLEHAYRNASISEDTYRRVKQVNQELLN